MISRDGLTDERISELSEVLGTAQWNGVKLWREESERKDRLIATYMASNRRVHELKVWPEFFQALHTGEKTFELRKDDRGYQAGDVLHLREWNPRSETYSGREQRRLVTYLISGNWGLEKDVVCMALAPLYAASPAKPAEQQAPAGEVTDTLKLVREAFGEELEDWSGDLRAAVSWAFDDAFKRIARRVKAEAEQQPSETAIHNAAVDDVLTVGYIRAFPLRPGAQEAAKPQERVGIVRLTDDNIAEIGFRVFGCRPNKQETEFAREIEEAARENIGHATQEADKPKTALMTMAGAWVGSEK